MSINIVDKNLSRIIKVKLCVEGIKNVEEIKDISIQDINLMQRKLNIDLTEIVKMKNLKSLSLKFFEITDEVIEAINQLEFLENIEFSMCTFNTKKLINRNLKSIIIYNCIDFDLCILDKNITLEKIQLIHSGLVNIDELNIFEKLKYLKVSNCNVISIPSISVFKELEKLYLNDVDLQYDIDISKLANLKFISLNGSVVADKLNYIEKLKKQNENVIIEFEENNLPIE